MGRGQGRWSLEAGGGEVKAEETVIDPACESYIAKKGAIRASQGGKEFYFCSTEFAGITYISN